MIHPSDRKVPHFINEVWLEYLKLHKLKRSKFMVVVGEKLMKHNYANIRVTFFFITLVVFSYTIQAQNLADVARKERERRQKVHAQKVYTNKDLAEIKKQNRARINIPPARAVPPRKSRPSTETKKPETITGPLQSLTQQLKELEQKRNTLLKQKQKKEEELRKLNQQINTSNAMYMSTNFGDLVEKRSNLRNEIHKLEIELEKMNRNIEDVKIQINAIKDMQKREDKNIVFEEP